MNPSSSHSTSFTSRRTLSRHLYLGLFIAATSLSGPSAQAITETWNGAGATWQSAANWTATSSVVPSATTLTEFNSGSYPNQPNTGSTAAASGAVWVTTGVNTDVTIGGTGLLTIAGNLAAANGPGGLASTAILLDDTANHNLTFNAPVSVSGSSIVINNSGTVTFAGAFSGGGTTTVSGTGGIVSFGSTTAGGALLVNTTGTVVNLTGATGGFSTSGVLVNGGTVNVTGTITSTKGATVNGGTLNLNGAGAISNSLGVTTGSVTANTTNAITGAAAVTVGGGTLTLIQSNDFSGATKLTGGSLVLGNDGALGTSVVTLGGGTLSSSTTVNMANNVLVSTGNGKFGGSADLTISGSFTNSGAANRIITLNNTGLITLSGNVYFSDSTTGRTPTFTGTGALTISGVIADSSTSGASASGLAFTGSNTLSLTNTNTYSGVTSVNGGTLSVGVLADGTNASSLGQSSNAATNLLFTNATLKYTGSGGSTDRLFTITGGTTPGIFATLDASGTGAVNFTNTGNIVYSNVNQTRTLNLTGTNKANNTLALKVDNNTGGVVNLTKSGVGTWNLTNVNGYTGGTVINGGLLKANNLASGSATGTGVVTVNSTGALGGGMGASNGGSLGSLAYGATSKTYATGLGTISGAVTINSAGHLAPGNGLGTLAMSSLTLAAGSVLDYEFNATANDFVSAGGTLTLSLGSPTGFNLYQEGTTNAFASAGTYNLIQYGGLAGAGSIANLAVLNQQAGFSYTFINDSTDQVIQLNIAAVPEPGTWAMMLGGLVCLVAIQRRKVKSV